jgi:hypothetical protein
MSEELEMVQVRTCQGWDVAQIYKANLEAQGIPVLLKYESVGIVYGITVDGLGQVGILVPAEFAEEAQAIVEDVVELTAEDWEEDEEIAAEEEDPD